MAKDVSEITETAEVPQPGQSTGQQGQSDGPLAIVPNLVPPIGLALALVVIIGLIAAIVSNTKWALDFFHVAGGALWTAIDLFMGLIIGPILGTLAPAARVALTAKLMPKMLVIMPTVVTMTLGSGFQLARKLGNLSPSFPYHDWLVASFFIVGAMAIIALGLLEPANVVVLLELRRPSLRPEIIEKFMKRFIYTAGLTGVMQIATLVIMTRVASS